MDTKQVGLRACLIVFMDSTDLVPVHASTTLPAVPTAATTTYHPPPGPCTHCVPLQLHTLLPLVLHPLLPLHCCHYNYPSATRFVYHLGLLSHVADSAVRAAAGCIEWMSDEIQRDFNNSTQNPLACRWAGLRV